MKFFGDQELHPHFPLIQTRQDIQAVEFWDFFIFSTCGSTKSWYLDAGCDECNEDLVWKECGESGNK
jgi:hypothetical protein